MINYKKLENWRKLPELKLLLDLPSPPKELYYSGTWSPALFKNCVAVVGSRKITSYGEQVVDKIIPSLVHQRKTVVSGFMYGVDQYAHKACIESGGKTIAVLGWGIDYKLTGSDLELAKNIVASGGLIISEWETQKPMLWTFPMRNRIVTALCQEVIVVEAAEKSGSLITATLASKLKRKLWAVPGPITSRTSKGTNQLIAKGLAHMWFGEPIQERLIDTNDPIINALESEALSTDEIARKLSLPVSEIGAKLSLLLLPDKCWKSQVNITYPIDIPLSKQYNYIMNTTVLQVPIDKNIRDQATSVAKEMGFSSLQEAIRLFVNRISKGEINFNFEETVQLSPKAIKRYNKMIDEIEAGKNIIGPFDTVDDLMKSLNEN